jgi:hypothetical protein
MGASVMVWPGQVNDASAMGRRTNGAWRDLCHPLADDIDDPGKLFGHDSRRKSAASYEALMDRKEWQGGRSMTLVCYGMAIITNVWAHPARMGDYQSSPTDPTTIVNFFTDIRSTW